MAHDSSKALHSKHPAHNPSILRDFSFGLPSRNFVPRIETSLSHYFPRGLVYFYAFPSGEHSRFYNQVPTFVEELVAGRPLVCSGNGAKVITFSAAADPYILDLLSKSVPVASNSKIISLPKSIDPLKKGNIRNEMVVNALMEAVGDNQLVMAQPFLDPCLQKKFKINPVLSVALNDKQNKALYIPHKYLPKKYAFFANGREFYASNARVPYPNVVKITSSSSGDGVTICRSEKELAAVKKKYVQVKGAIFIEEFIDFVANVCVQFGIPSDKTYAPSVLGFNEQVTTREGGFLGGIVNRAKVIPELDVIEEVLIEQVLPNIRRYGWYGIGGIDVLITRSGKFYFIDPNFRMTATFAYVYLANMKKVTMPLVSFTGLITCSKSYFEKQVIPLVIGNSAPLKIISLTRHGNTFRFNAGMQFESLKDMKKKATHLLGIGVMSPVLANLTRSSFEYNIS